MNDFSFADNQLTGTIPSLAGLPNLKYFLVYNNRLTGTIPLLTGLPSLAYFMVHNNQLTDTLPSLAGLTNLVSFNIQNNQLTGAVPDVPSTSALPPSQFTSLSEPLDTIQEYGLGYGHWPHTLEPAMVLIAAPK